jgi:hypothetical protein
VCPTPLGNRTLFSVALTWSLLRASWLFLYHRTDCRSPMESEKERPRRAFPGQKRGRKCSIGPMVCAMPNRQNGATGDRRDGNARRSEDRENGGSAFRPPTNGGGIVPGNETLSGCGRIPGFNDGHVWVKAVRIETALRSQCQSASGIDPPSAAKTDPARRCAIGSARSRVAPSTLCCSSPAGSGHDADRGSGWVIRGRRLTGVAGVPRAGLHGRLARIHGARKSV